MLLSKPKIAFPVFLSFALLCAAAAKAEEQQKPRVELAFVLDTTGSMGDLIDGAKQKIWSIANAVVDANPGAEIYVGLVGYRDLGDEYVTRDYKLTTDIQGVYAKLLAFRAEGGGDTPESVNEALDVGVTRLGWSDPKQVEARRILFLVGDAPPHMDYKQDRKYPEIVKDAVARGIIVNAVQAGNMSETRRVWQEIARMGKGDYLEIPQDGGKVITISTPYDVRINEIQIRVNKTVLPYGSRTQQEDVKRKAEMPSSSAVSMESKADMARYVSKTGEGAVITGKGDLLADLESGAQTLSTLTAEELPAPMRNMSSGEREAYVAARLKERESLSGELGELIAQRDAYIRQETEKQGSGTAAGDSFDRSVLRVLERQMK